MQAGRYWSSRPIPCQLCSKEGSRLSTVILVDQAVQSSSLVLVMIAFSGGTVVAPAPAGPVAPGGASQPVGSLWPRRGQLRLLTLGSLYALYSLWPCGQSS